MENKGILEPRKNNNLKTKIKVLQAKYISCHNEIEAMDLVS